MSRSDDDSLRIHIRRASEKAASIVPPAIKRLDRVAAAANAEAAAVQREARRTRSYTQLKAIRVPVTDEDLQK